MKKFTSIFLACALLLCLAGCGGSGDAAVTVEKVENIASLGSVGTVNRYAALVVSGETASISKGDKTVAEVLVKEGDWVSEGDILFSYDTEAMELELTRLQLELEGLENTILTAQEEIPELERQRDAVAAGQQLSYTLQIQSLQADVREATYNKGVKEREIESLQTMLEDTDVRAPISGRVMSVNESDSAGSAYGGYSEGDSTAFITIMDVTTYQVKGTINEMNIGSLYEGMRVIVRSRLDENVVWRGTLDKIDWENQVSNSSGSYYYYDGNSEMTTSTKYPFYVSLEDVTGLILGQHVFVEPDLGQMDARDGLWLPEYYISDAESAPWVWAANARGRLEKRTITLGAHDADSGEYEILSGLTAEDCIAFPAEDLEAGQATVVYDPSAFTAPEYGEYDFPEEGAFLGDEELEDGAFFGEDGAEFFPGAEEGEVDDAP